MDERDVIMLYIQVGGALLVSAIKIGRAHV